MCWWCCWSRRCWHWWGLKSNCLGIRLLYLDGDIICNCLVGVEACPCRFWWEWCVWEHIITGFEAVAGECREYWPGRDQVANAECRFAQRLGMKDAGVWLKRLLRREVARNRRVSAQSHSDGGLGWSEELGQRYCVIINASALAPAYQGDNL